MVQNHQNADSIGRKVIVLYRYKKGEAIASRVDYTQSPNQGGNHSITLANLVCFNEPKVAPLAFHCGAQNPGGFHINHHGVNGALVAPGIETHAPHKVGARLRSDLDQGSADGGADDGGEDHRSVWCG